MLQDPPHAIDIIARMSPIPLSVEVAEVQTILFTELDLSDCARDLARHECPATARRLVVEEDAIDCEHVVTFTEVDYDPCEYVS